MKETEWNGILVLGLRENDKFYLSHVLDVLVTFKNVDCMDRELQGREIFL